MNATMILSLIGPLSQAIGGLIHQAQILHDAGEMTDAQLAQVKADASLSDSQWDAAVEAAKARIAA